MLGAFLMYKQQCTAAEAEALKDLYTIEHRKRDFVIIDGQMVEPQKIGPPIPSRPCTVPSCVRCNGLAGGYQFRWYSPKWDAEYRKGARPGSWFPSDPDT